MITPGSIDGIPSAKGFSPPSLGGLKFVGKLKPAGTPAKSPKNHR
jgi:hypothetical protein